MEWKCFNCNKFSDTEEYLQGKGLFQDKWKQIKLNCNKCNSKNTFIAQFANNKKNNMIACLISYEVDINVESLVSFKYQETKNNFTISGYISNIYLLLGFDDEKQLKEISSKINNQADKTLFNNGFNIIKIARNKITQHNKKKDQLSLLTENEIFEVVNNIGNMLVNIAKKHNLNIFDLKDRRIKSREMKIK